MSVDLRLPAYKVLADDLRAQITSGRLRPGDRLPTEPQLGRTSGVSRSTVREALRQLASQNLIVTVRGVAGGSFVAHPSPAQLCDTLTTGVRLLQASSVVGVDELLEVRAMFEIASSGLAARRRTEEDLVALRATLFDPADADLDTMLRLHPAFHVAIAHACANPLLELITTPLQTIANAREFVEGIDAGFWVRIDADHRAIAAAIDEQKPDEAEAAAARHLHHLREVFVADPGDQSVSAAGA